jgi:hypothetical protein
MHLPSGVPANGALTIAEVAKPVGVKVTDTEAPTVFIPLVQDRDAEYIMSIDERANLRSNESRSLVCVGCAAGGVGVGGAVGLEIGKGVPAGRGDAAAPLVGFESGAAAIEASDGRSAFDTVGALVVEVRSSSVGPMFWTTITATALASAIPAMTPPMTRSGPRVDARGAAGLAMGAAPLHV